MSNIELNDRKGVKRKMDNVPIIVDGPNYINRIIDIGIDPVHIARQLSLDRLMDVLSEKIIDIKGVSSRCGFVEFICSRRRFGPKSKHFTEPQQKMLIDRLRGETGVYVDVIEIPGSSEKGVDTTISGRIHEYANDVDTLILVSEDRDYIPTLNKLRHRIKIILVALRDEYPSELQNEAYATIFLHEDYRGLFKYRYPMLSVKDFDQEKCAELYSEADDRTHNQVRVTHNGFVYISLKVGAQDLYDVKFRFETSCPYNGYVGPKAASDVKYISKEAEAITLGWQRGASGYIDFPIEAVWKDDKEL